MGRGARGGLASSHQFSVDVTGSQYPGWEMGPYGNDGSQAGIVGG